MNKWVHWTFWTPKLLLNVTVFIRSITLQQHEPSNTSSQHPMHSLTRNHDQPVLFKQPVGYSRASFSQLLLHPLHHLWLNYLVTPGGPWSTCMTLGNCLHQITTYWFWERKRLTFGCFLAFLCRSNWSPPCIHASPMAVHFSKFSQGFWDPSMDCIFSPSKNVVLSTAFQPNWNDIRSHLKTAWCH